MPKKIEYVSTKLVAKRWYNFREKIIPTIQEEILRKYTQYFCEPVLGSPAAIYESLGAMLYLKSILRPTYIDQLTMIYNLRQLVGDGAPQLHAICEKYYEYAYSRLYFILSERSRYDEAGTLSKTFFEVLNLVEEQFPMEHAVKYLDYVEEITRKLIEVMTAMVLEQIYAFFPSEGPAFYQSLFIENSSSEQSLFQSASVVAAVAEESEVESKDIQPRKKVTFSL